MWVLVINLSAEPIGNFLGHCGACWRWDVVGGSLCSRSGVSVVVVGVVVRL